MRFFFIFGCTSAYRKPLKNKGIWVGIFQCSRVGIFPCGMCENGAYIGLYNLTERKYNFNKFTQITPSTVYIIFPHTHSLTKPLVKWDKSCLSTANNHFKKSTLRIHNNSNNSYFCTRKYLPHIHAKSSKKLHLYTIPTTH